MVSLTARAASELRAAQLSKHAQGHGVRVQLVGGGCEGFLYDLLFVDQPDPEDQVFESEGLRLFVDPHSKPALEGLVIDCGRTRYGWGFLFHNPRAARRCGCGASFAL